MSLNEYGVATYLRINIIIREDAPNIPYDLEHTAAHHGDAEAEPCLLAGEALGEEDERGEASRSWSRSLRYCLSLVCVLNAPCSIPYPLASPLTLLPLFPPSLVHTYQDTSKESSQSAPRPNTA